ncbi:MAG: DUF2784 domain-containing protein [Bacteroidia bacterium]|nr:DUF2784 domain-containing protein [Bacteroidia bacterium]
MKDFWLHSLDYFFLVFHTTFTLFNITGWIWKKTRKIHLFTMLVTLFSWGILGIWYGFGYCFCTDWHWQVREMLGAPSKHGSYISFLIDELTGLKFSRQIVDNTVLIVFIISFTLTIVLNIRDILKKRYTGKKRIRTYFLL